MIVPSPFYLTFKAQFLCLEAGLFSSSVVEHIAMKRGFIWCFFQNWTNQIIYSWFLEIHKYEKSIRFLTYSILIAKKIFLYVGVEKKLATKRLRKDALSVKLCILAFFIFQNVNEKSTPIYVVSKSGYVKLINTMFDLKTSKMQWWQSSGSDILSSQTIPIFLRK